MTMKKSRIFFVCAFIALFFAIASPVASASDIDILDVKTTFKIGGVDKTRVVISDGTNTVIVKGVQSVTGSSTFNPSTVGTLSAVLVSLDTIANDARYAAGTSSGQNITLSVYGIGAGTATTLSTTATRVHYIAVGTPE